MELQFRRPLQNKDETASVLLKSGETIDDSMAMFDAVNLSGGLKKALMSLSVGMHCQLQLFQLIQTPTYFPSLTYISFHYSSLPSCHFYRHHHHH